MFFTKVNGQIYIIGVDYRIAQLIAVPLPLEFGMGFYKYACKMCIISMYAYVVLCHSGHWHFSREQLRWQKIKELIL